MLPIVMGICATVPVLLQQGCNNTSEGKEAKKIQASHQNKFVHMLMPQLSDEKSTLLCVCF